MAAEVPESLLDLTGRVRNNSIVFAQRLVYLEAHVRKGKLRVPTLVWSLRGDVLAS